MKYLIFRAYLFAILVNLPIFTAFGQNEADFTRAEIESAWNQNREHHSLRYDEVWNDYLENREQIEREIASGTGNPQIIRKAEMIAKAAIYLEAPEYRELAIRAINLTKSSGGEMGGVQEVGALSGIQMALLDIGAIDFALELRQLLRPKNISAAGFPPEVMAALVAVGDSRAAKELGDFRGEEDALLTILKGFKSQGDPDGRPGSPARASSSSIWARLAHVQAAQGKFEAASESMDKALELYGPILVKGGGALKVASSQSQNFSRMQGFAETLFLLGRFEESKRFIIEGLELTDRPWIQDNPYFWKIFALAGRVALEGGNGAQAKSYWERALEAVRRKDTRTSYTRSEIHPDVVAVKEGLGWALLLEGNSTSSDYALSVSEARTQQVDQLFRFASERQRLVYLQSFDPFSLLAETGQVDALAESILRYKGSVLDSILEEKRIAARAESPEMKEIARELRVSKRLAFEAAWSGSEDADELAKEVQTIEAKFGAVAAGDAGGREALRIRAAQVKAVLGEKDRLCEFVKYRALRNRGGTVPSYGVMVFSNSFEPSWIPLGEAASIEGNIRRLNKAMAQQGELSDEELEELLSGLYDRLWLPIENEIPDGTRVIISPDGDLSCLSFSVLLDEKSRFATSRWPISYVSTGRDLLAPAEAPKASVKVGVFADPDFALDPSGFDGKQNIDELHVPFRLGGVILPRLPGTRKESERIGDSAGRFGWDLQILEGVEAREEALNSFSGHSPEILHFATHGLFLERQPAVEFASRYTSPGMTPSGRFDNPLLRALLTLSGAQTSIERLAGGEQRRDPTGDGLVTAEEISQLDLSNTWLAVLSACDTASGETLEGEGVLGLRRGFFLAGVDHLMITFWPIADEQTVDFIDSFYSKLEERGHPGLALASVQAESLETIRQKLGIKAAVLFAGPFAVSGSGSLPTP